MRLEQVNFNEDIKNIFVRIAQNPIYLMTIVLIMQTVSKAI